MVDKSQQRQNISNSSRVHLRFAGPTPVDLIHDFLCPAKGVRDRSNGCGHALPAVVLRELPCRENRRGELLCAGAFFGIIGSILIALAPAKQLVERASTVVL